MVEPRKEIEEKNKTKQNEEYHANVGGKRLGSTFSIEIMVQ